MANPDWIDPLSYEWRKGDRFLVPGFFESTVAAVDFDDMQVMDDCGGWHDMAEIERVS